jgi:serine/threonine protein kinase
MIAADARSGTTVGKYRLHEVVGRGGMGVVYRAEHVYIGREVAVKILHEGYGAREDSIKRFLREARAASLINHPNIVEVTDFGKATDGTVFFVMELLIGEPLDAVLARDKRLALLRSITICNQLAAALAAAHSKGIIHRDLKPENVMLISREGRRELVRRVSDESGAHEISERETRFDFVKILDFGVAKMLEPEGEKGRVTQAGVVFGTPEYMAPETARIGYSDARSDIYALGVMFYEMLTGTVPFTGEAPVDVMMKQVNDRVPPLHEMAPEAEITEETERTILKALAKDPEQRQQSMEEFRRDLQKCYGHLRFRRTLKTPTVHTAQIDAIPLTKKKNPASGAIPDGTSSVNSVLVEYDASGPVRLVTPGSGAAPVSAPALDPILLTKRKPRAESGPEPIESRKTPPQVPAPAAASSTAEATPIPPLAARAPAAPPPPPRKRTTLPLGLQPSAEGPGTRPAEAPERITPRVPIDAVAPASDGAGGGGDENLNWFDDPTVPGLSGRPR